MLTLLSLAANNNNNGNNWFELGGAGDDLSWERLLGLDGSFVFLEHILWVISLNTFFTIVFGERLLYYLQAVFNTIRLVNLYSYAFVFTV